MSKIVFISLNDINSEGVRGMSAYLKQHGQKSYIIFLKRYKAGIEDLRLRKTVEGYDWVGVGRDGRPFRYSRGTEITSKEKDILYSLIEEINPDIIGFSVTTPLKEYITDVTRSIKARFNIPIIWGGPHPTIDASDSLKYCDFVCTGEGEQTILDIATHIDEKRDITEINNVAYQKNSQVIKNPLYALINNLDKLPFKDICPDNKFLIDDNSLVRNFNEVSYSHNLKYHMISSRGCPYNCSYCCENFFKKLYSLEVFLRRRSPQNVIQELKESKKIIDYKSIVFEDEVFSFDYEWLREFKDMYKKEIDLPFSCYIYPNMNIKKQLEILKETGLTETTLAVQSGSERINRDIFNRPFSKALLLETANLLKTLGISFSTDIITYNPFEDEKDLESSLDVLLELPKPFNLAVNKLYFIKGTAIFDMMGNIGNNKVKTLVSKKTFDYYSRMFWLATQCNKNVIKRIKKAAVFRRFPSLVTWVLYFYDIRRKIKKVLRNPIVVYKKIGKLIRMKTE